MRIAILGSVALPVPPPAQGGTEWIAYYQAEGLAKLGHEVILFAAKGSQKGAYRFIEAGGGDTVVGSDNAAGPAVQVSRELLQIAREKNISYPFNSSSLAHPSVKQFPGVLSSRHPLASFTESSRKMRQENVYLSQVMEKLIEMKDEYDVILNNMRGEAVFLPVAKMLKKPFVNVMHLPLFDKLAGIFREFDTHVITISNAQRKDFPDLNYLATVYNCVDTEKYAFDAVGGDYLLMMGSIARHKNQAGAIAVAKKLGMKLVLAGKINDRKYFDELEKDIDGDQIRWVGELNFKDKLKLYQKAKIFIFSIQWEEPFGLVMIEAMAAGTPVVAFANGAIPEVVVDGKTGYVIDYHISDLSYLSNLKIKSQGIDGMVEAVEKIVGMSREEYQTLRQNCRKHVEENFTVEKMVKDYEKALLSLGG